MNYRFLKISKTPTAALIDLLNNNIIGTVGQGMVYQHLEIQKKIDNIPNPTYVSLVKEDTVLGTCCFCNRDTLNANNVIPSFYLRYFTFKSSYRSVHKTTIHKERSNSILRKEVIQLLTGEGLGYPTQKSFFHYAYVDPKNSRSLALCNEFGFEPVRKFSTIIFNRISPKSSNKVEKLLPAEFSDMRNKLTFFYKDYTMFSTENLFNTQEYYVIRNDKGIFVAGIQATPDNWKVLELPGASGKIILNLFSALPYLNRFIKKDYRFVTLEGVFFTLGNEKQIELLIESVLAKYNRNSAMIWVDCNSHLYKTLKSLDLGVLDKINHEVVANVICKFVNINKEDQLVFKLNPAYISGTDLT